MKNTKKRQKGKERGHEHKAFALFLVFVFIACVAVLLKNPKIVGYATKEQSIEVLNKQSYTAVNEQWIVRFQTEGEGDLEIIEIQDSFYLVGMPYIRCGDQIVPYEYKTGKFIAKDYKCDLVSTITMEVREEGIETIKLKFGNKDYASNTAIRKEKI